METFINGDIVRILNMNSTIVNLIGRVRQQRADGKVIVDVDGIDWKVNPTNLKLLKRKEYDSNG